MQKSLNASMRRQQTLVKSTDKVVKKAARDRIAALKYEQILLKRAIDLEKGKGAAAFASGKAKQVQVFQDAATNEIVSFTNKEQSFTQAWKNIGQGANNYRDEMVDVAEETSKTGAKLGTFGKVQLWMSKTTKALTQRLVLLKAAFLQLLPWIAAAVIVIGTIIALQRRWFNTDEQKKYQKGLDDMATLFDELSEKVEKYDKALANGRDLAAAQIAAFKIQSGIIKGINAQLKENIRLRKLAAESRGEEEDKGGAMQRPDLQGLRNKRLETTSAMFKQMGEGADINYILKELQLSQDAFSNLNIENPFEWMTDNSMDISTVLNNFQDIEGSLEVEALKQLFTEGIPGQADFMMKRLRIVMGQNWNADEMREALQGIVQETDEAFGPLGPTIEGLAEAFKEAEKESTKYLRSFAKKTSVDDFIASTTSTIKIIEDLKTGLSKTGMNVESGIGVALLNVGSTLSDILGPGFKEAQREAKAAGKAMEAANKVIGDGSDEAKLVDEKAEALAVYEDRLIAVNKNLKDTQRLELTRVTLFKGMDKMMKFASKNYKNNVQLAGLENKQLRRKLELEQKIQESKIKEVKTLFEKQKFNVRDEKGKITIQEKEIEFAEFMKKNLTDQLDIVEQSGVGAQNLFALRESMFNQSLRHWDIQKNIWQQQDIALIQRTEAEMKLLKIGKELLDQKRDISKVDEQIANFKKTGKTGLNAKQESDFKIQAAIEAARYAVNTQNAELAMIDARASIQKAEMIILDKQIELYNQQARDTHTGPGAAAQVERLELSTAFEAIDKLAKYEKIKVRQTTELLQKNVTLAFLEGWESLKKAIDEDSIGIGEALTGGAKLSQGARMSEDVTGGDSKKALDFYDSALTKGSIFTHDIPMEDILKTVNGSITSGTDAQIQAYTDGVNDTLAKQMEIETDRKYDEEQKKRDGDRNPPDTESENKKPAISSLPATWDSDMDKIKAAELIFGELNKAIEGFGPESEAMMAMRSGMIATMTAINELATSTGDKVAKLELASKVIGGIGDMMAASAKQATARIDMLIGAEKGRDGKSKESLEKIKGLEKKKIAIQRKAFETKKKIAIAETIISTSAAAMKSYDSMGGGIPGAIAAAITIAFGLAQVSMIRKQQFQGGGGADDIKPPGKIEVGKRNNKVDVSRTASAGELSYLRGERGIGTTANNFTAQNGAAGLRKGYADGGQIVVGERGPETITPLTGLNVVPNQGMKNVVNASFTIHAVDAQGVEEVLMGQQGHIINMIRSAANENGEEFLESVNTQTYGNPQSDGGVDY